MGIQINGQTDTITATDGSLSIQGASGNLTGNLTGDVTGNLTGDVTGNLTGDVTGNVTGNLTGDVTGNVTGNVTGDITIGAGSTSAPSLSPSGDSNTGVFFPSADTIAFAEGGSEAARIDSSSRLLLGTSTATSSFKFGGSGDTATLAQFDGASSSRNVGLALVNHHTSDTQPVLRLAKSRGTAASPTVVSSNDNTGSIQFMGYDGTRYIDTARIDSQVDATPGTNDMPGRLVFSTTSDGGSVVTERLRIRANGNTEPGADNTYTIGTSASRWGSVWAANGTIQTSDERTKTQIANAHLGFEFIKSLRPVSYRWIEGGKRETGERNEDGTAIYESVPGERTHYGFIAQEVKEAVDAAGVDFGGWLLSDKDDPDSQQALRYDQFIAPLTKALQEAITKIETLETANASQAATIAALDARLTALEGA